MFILSAKAAGFRSDSYLFTKVLAGKESCWGKHCSWELWSSNRNEFPGRGRAPCRINGTAEADSNDSLDIILIALITTAHALFIIIFFLLFYVWLGHLFGDLRKLSLTKHPWLLERSYSNSSLINLLVKKLQSVSGTGFDAGSGLKVVRPGHQDADLHVNG